MGLQLNTENQFRFLYDGYDQRRGRFLWEAVVLARKVAVIAVAALIDDPFNQAFSGMLCSCFVMFACFLIGTGCMCLLLLRRLVFDALGLVAPHFVSTL